MLHKGRTFLLYKIIIRVILYLTIFVKTNIMIVVYVIKEKLYRAEGREGNGNIQCNPV